MWKLINDETVSNYLRRRDGVARVLVEDQAETVAGSLWAHIKDMAGRGLVKIENDTAYLITN